ncbi:UGSC family (seleno)protein [Saccharomonospora sp. NPDC046836]|uniref:UGSC family (seleno)protein n=1 Tax=Saccharomonospora sp. NPDC046836 TaxID=3156921 RepID=UPI0033E0561D
MFEAMIDPTTRPSGGTTSGARAPRHGTLNGLTVGLLANVKQNAEEFLGAVGDLLAAEHGTAGVVRRKKLSITDPVPASMLAELADACDVVVIGVGDCGSCSASAVADGLAFEAAGIPAAVICSDAFAVSADAMANVMGESGYTYVTTAHPVAPLNSGEVRERATTALPTIVGLLTAQANTTAAA